MNFSNEIDYLSYADNILDLYAGLNDIQHLTHEMFSPFFYYKGVIFCPAHYNEFTGSPKNEASNNKLTSGIEELKMESEKSAFYISFR